MTAKAAPTAARSLRVPVLLAVLLSAGVVYVGALLGPWPLSVRRPVAETLLGLTAIGCGLVIAVARRHAETSTRRAWRYAAWAALSWGAGQTWFALERLITGDVVRPGLSDVGFLLAVVFAVRGSLAFPTAAASRLGQARALLDGMAVSCSALLLTWVLVLDTGGALHELGLRLAYPLLDCVVATVLVSAAVRLPRAEARPLALALAGLLVLILTNLLVFAQARRGSLPAPAPAEGGFLVGFGLTALGALLPERAVGRLGSTGHRLQQLLPYAAVPPALAAVALHRDDLSDTTWGLTLTVVTLYLLRQVLVVAENSELTQQLLQRSERNDELVALLHREALTDDLTGLGNRRALLQEAPTWTGPVALLYLDLDQFKRINDSLGHATGDGLLRQTAARLRALLQEDDVVVRLGGDEFAVVLAGVDSEAAALAAADTVLEELARPVLVDGVQVWSGASIGIALSRDVVHGGRAATPEALLAELMRDADTALYVAKSDGRGRARAYRPAMHDAVHDRLVLERDLRAALEQGDLEVHYQPVVRLADGSTPGVEALVRWHHPQRGLISPEVFVGLAEEAGLVGVLGEQVLRRALRDCVAWERDLGLVITAAVNVSPRQLDAGLPGLVRACLAEVGLPPQRLLLEVTERSLLAGSRAAAVLAELNALGVRLALDDFGTGWSSLAHLQEHPVDVIKLDRSYVGTLETDVRSRALVLGLLDLAGHLGLSVTAEGVEDAATADALAAAGCQYAQGYHWARPMPEPALRSWLTTRRTALVPGPRRSSGIPGAHRS